MKIKTINKVIRAKMLEWLETIPDKTFRKEVKDNILVSGGCIASLLTQTSVNDYDLYFKSKSVLKKLIQYYMNKFDCPMVLLDGEDDNSSIELDGVDIEINDKEYNGLNIAISNLTEDRLKLYSSNGIYREDILKIRERNNVRKDETLNGIYEPIVWTANAISLTNGIQIIIRFHGTIEEIHSNYDFVHATNYWSFDTDLVCNIEALQSLMSKQLIYKGSKYPLTSIIRTKKFLNRGYTITAGEYLKMCWQVSLLDLSNPYVLEEQLMGVDVAYFSVLIDILRNAIEKDPDFKISTDWLFVIIDKVFNESDEND